MKDLHDKEASVEFYEARYEHGYMEEWDEAKKNKVREILKTLPLPTSGVALDFGCGNGIFTRILKDCLPQWDVYGVEISKTAVANAQRKNQDCKFFIADDAADYKKRFDFLFSHHVIEHVPDLTETFQTINNYLKDRAYQLHILPCRNEESFEYSLCQLRKNGIEVKKENRFFFEEDGHLRRLNTQEFEQQENKIGFTLTSEFYANQYSGAINWITKSSPRFVKKITSLEGAVDEKGKKELVLLRKKLLRLTYAQFAYSKYWAIQAKWKKTAADRLKLVALFGPSLLAKPTYIRLQQEADQEWSESKGKRNGSEMFLFFKR